MKLILLTLTALALAAQTPKASIVIRVTDDAGTLYVAKITGAPASAGLEVLSKWMATQTACDAAKPPVCSPKYPNAAEVVKSLTLDTTEKLAKQYPSSQTEADVAEITAKIAALEAKRKALFDAARSEK